MKRIRNLKDLQRAAMNRRSVVGLFAGKVYSAAWALNVSYCIVASAMKRGMYMYEPKGKKTAVKRYRMLKVGEMILDTDQFDDGHKWNTVTHKGYPVPSLLKGYYRRPIGKATQ